MNITLNAPVSPVFQAAPADSFRWQEPLATRLRYRHDLPGRVANRLLNVELGLFLMAELLPFAPIETLPGLLNGQGAAYRLRPIWSPKQHRYLSRARILLAPYQSQTVWLNALARYTTLPTSLQAFTLAGPGNWQIVASGAGLPERLNLFRRALV